MHGPGQPGLDTIDLAAWSRLRDAQEPGDFAYAWLELQGRFLGGIEAGVVILGPPDTGPFTPVAVTPDSHAVDVDLSIALEQAMAGRQGVVREGGAGPEGGHAVAYPLILDGRLHGAVGVQVSNRSEGQIRALLRQLQWGAVWLEVLVRRKTLLPKERMATILDVMAACLDQDRFFPAVTAVVNELAVAMRCDWVACGLRDARGHTHLAAISHNAAFAERTNLNRAVVACMDEALDQNDAVTIPADARSSLVADRAHRDLSGQTGGASLCTIPFGNGSRLLGAFVFGRAAADPFDRADLQVCRTVGLVVGPVLHMMRQEDRWIGAKAADAARGQLGRILGPRHLATKLAGLAATAAIVGVASLQGDYRVHAPARLEGEIQRAVAAPFDGYVAEAAVRPGDRVESGQLLAALDGEDLRLERIRWISQREQKLQEYRTTLAASDWAKGRVVKAQIDQAEAKLALVEDQLARIRIAAPLSGIVVRGDLSQSLGAPVTRGQVLFEVAPLDQYRVVMRVNEWEISQVAPGQEAQLALSALPGRSLKMLVQTVTPVSSVEEGRNFFRVEGLLQERLDLLRPGMEGVAKITIDRRSLVWIWTRELIHWWKLRLWSWLP